jgi:endonuclease/exonuclease/phosphatase (EEP) superfamily protein YafD
MQARPYARLASAWDCGNFEHLKTVSAQRGPGFLARVSRLFVLGSIVSASAVGCVAAAPLQPREPTPGVPHFSVMTYNVHKDRWRNENTLAAISNADADIVCLQETTAAWARVLTERFAARYPTMLFATREDAGGLAIFSKWPVEDRGVMPFSHDWHPGWYVIAETPGGRVQLLQVHLRAKFEGNSDPLSNFLDTGHDHRAELDFFMKGMDPGMPTLVVGDFNESPNGHAVRSLEARGFRNALPLYRPGQVTWKGKSVAAMLDMTIDHIMFDHFFEPLSAWVDSSGGSDHLPVIANVEMPGASLQAVGALGDQSGGQDPSEPVRDRDASVVPPREGVEVLPADPVLDTDRPAVVPPDAQPGR